MKTVKIFLFVALATFLVSSCVSVSIFEEQPQRGGELVVSAFFKDKDGPEARMQLDQAMRSNCSPYGYVIDTKRFVKVGTETYNHGEQREGAKQTHHISDIFGDVSSYEGGKTTQSSSSSSTRDSYQWRVKYHCVKN